MVNEISAGVSRICINDNLTDLFEGQYPIPDGITYNSYVINDGKRVVFDTADVHFCEEWLADLSSVTGGEAPDYLVVLHMEPDHSGSIARAMELFPEMKIVGSAKAIAMLSQFFEDTPLEGRTIAMADGDTLSVGATTLRFLTAPMVHWPEVLVAYDEKRKIIFSADGFGTFGTTGFTPWASEARRYYANICGKYGMQVQGLLKKVSTLDVETIAPLHGPPLHSPLKQYIELYDRWSRYVPDEKGVLVAYASVYGGTAECAMRVAAMLNEAGVTTEVIDLCRKDVSYAVGEAFRMSTLLLAAPTYDGDLFPPMYNFLHHLKMKGFRNRHVGIIENGSWAPVAARMMTSLLEQMKDMTVVAPVVTLRSRMHRSDEEALRSLAASLTDTCR